MLARLPIALTKVKVDNTLDDLLNEIGYIFLFFVLSKKKLLKIYNNMIQQMQVLSYRQNIIKWILYFWIHKK